MNILVSYFTVERFAEFNIIGFLINVGSPVINLRVIV